MAGDAAEILRELRVGLLECKVCFEKLSCGPGGRWPLNLPCGHVVCASCVGALSRPPGGRLDCPFCRRPCDPEDTSPCRALCDLQELLASRAPPPRPRGGPGSAPGSEAAVLRRRLTFGGWGALINPSGMAALGSSGSTVAVHDGERRVRVFGPRGTELHAFGQKKDGVRGVCFPVGVAVTPCGHVVVTDAGEPAVKVFTSRGGHVLTISDSFQLPWGVDADGRGRVLVSDVRAGTLSLLKLDYKHAVAVEQRAAVSGLCRPKAVACCRGTGNTALVEHLDPRGPSRLTVFTPDFHVLFQTDSFGLSLLSRWISVSAVTFRSNGDLLVADSGRGMIWNLEGVPGGGPLRPTPLGLDCLLRPVGLLWLRDTLMVLDAGDHAVKIYSSGPTAGAGEASRGPAHPRGTGGPHRRTCSDAEGEDSPAVTVL